MIRSHIWSYVGKSIGWGGGIKSLNECVFVYFTDAPGDSLSPCWNIFFSNKITEWWLNNQERITSDWVFVNNLSSFLVHWVTSHGHYKTSSNSFFCGGDQLLEIFDCELILTHILKTTKIPFLNIYTGFSHAEKREEKKWKRKMTWSRDILYNFDLSHILESFEFSLDWTCGLKK